MGHFIFIVLHFIAFLFGLVFLIITIPLHLIYAILQGKSDRSLKRKCPYCAEMVKVEAIICKHCGKDLDKLEPAPKESGVAVKQPKPVLLIILIVILGLAFYVLNNTKSAKSKTIQANTTKSTKVATSPKVKTDLDKAKELMDKNCADFVEIITYSSLQKETGMSRSQLLMNYNINLWEKSNAKGKGKQVGEINPGAHALILESGKDSYKIFTPMDEYIGWVSKIQVERTMRLNPDSREDCSSKSKKVSTYNKITVSGNHKYGPKLAKRLRYLSDVKEIQWIEIVRNTVYISFYPKPNDWKTIIQTAALHGNNEIDFGVHIWALDREQRGWRAGDGPYIGATTARYGAIE